MTDVTPDWEERVAKVFTAIDSYDEGELVARIDALVSELPPGSAIGLFERGAACDSTGHPDRAVPLYRAALDAGLVGERLGEPSSSWRARSATWGTRSKH